MGNKKPTSRKSKLKRPKTVLRLLDLEHSKTTVLNSLIAGTECCNGIFFEPVEGILPPIALVQQPRE